MVLGTRGTHLLDQALYIIEATAEERSWPLAKIEIRCAGDLEIAGWDYVQVMLFFNADFTVADNALHALYQALDQWGQELSDEERDLFSRTVYFDVQTAG
ncbi:MAG: hypothetical protein NTZ05_22645 [Chloroflexi bacterium]|nr:hypothetical protein [Chloroflexota bacterium]